MPRYLTFLCTLTFLICCLVALFNFIVDPYAIYHFETTDDERLSRIDQFYHMRVSKPWQLNQLKPNAIIIGTSRSARLRPQHVTWEDDSTYNFSVPGMTIYELYRFIQHAHASGSISKLMIGLDFEAFVTPEPTIRPGFAENRFAQSKADIGSLRSKIQFGADMADTLLSLPALSRSISALAGTGNPKQQRYFKDGTWNTTSPFLTGTPGYVYMAKTIVDTHRTKKLDNEKNLAAFANILRFCQQNDIDTRIFLTPTHVFHINLWHDLGHRGKWLDFHHKLVTVNTTVANETNKEPFQLWGFNHASGIVDEPIYRRDEATGSWFKDGVHFRGSLGTRIMNSVWGDDKSFGKILTAETVTDYLQAVDQLREEFQRKNVETNEIITGKICKAIAKQHTIPALCE